MMSLVCVVLLVIFCSVNRKPPSYKRTISQRNPTNTHPIMDPESVPLRAVSDPSGPLDPNLCQSLNPADIIQCASNAGAMRPTNHSACSLTSTTNQSGFSMGSKNVQFNFGSYSNNGINIRQGGNANLGATAVMVSGGGGYTLHQPNNDPCLINAPPPNYGSAGFITAQPLPGNPASAGCLLSGNVHPVHIAPMVASSGNHSSQLGQSHLLSNR